MSSRVRHRLAAPKPGTSTPGGREPQLSSPGRGDPRALPDSISPEIGRLYKSYFDHLSNMLRKAFGDGPPDPDDISQLAFQKVIERGDIASIENLRAFLWRTARNLVLNEKRREDVRSRHDYEIEQLFFATEGDASSAERVISAREQLSLVNALLEKMPENRRRAFYLHRVEGLTVAEVGRRLGISRTGAAKHIARAISDIDGFFADNAEKDR